MKPTRLSMAAALLAACCTTATFAADPAAGPAARPTAEGPRGGLRLSVAQQDKLFAIHHAAAPRRREQDRP